MPKPNFYGIIGTNGSGKSTLCNYLKKKGFYVVSLSSVVRDYVTKKGLPQERDILIKHANELKNKHGISYFADVCFKKAMASDHNNVVFDSIRHPSEIAYFKQKGVIMIGVEVSLEGRYNRIKVRQAETDLIDFDTFVQQDKLEREGQSDGQFIDKAMAMCDHKIDNNSDEAHLFEQVGHIIKTTME